MNSIVIQQRLCPRCGIRRTAQLGRSSTSLCFNCRLKWDAAQAASGPAARPPLAHPFSAPELQLACPVGGSELQRLKARRAAICGGIHIDWPHDHA